MNFTSFEPSHYEKVLKEIARYSRKRGCNSVRLEMSGEGNPDMYKCRSRIIKYAKEKCNMKVVYVSSGSNIDAAKDLMNAGADSFQIVKILVPEGEDIEKYKLSEKQ